MKPDILSYEISIKFRTLLTIVSLLAISTAIAFTLYSGIEERNRVDMEVDKEIEHAIKITNTEIDNFYDEVNRNLVLLSSALEVKGGSEEECNSYLGGFLRSHIQYANLGVADTDGDVICSAVPLDKPVNLSDRTYFSDAKETLMFTPGSYRINKITKTPTVSFGYPNLEGGNTIDRVVFASIDIDWFKSLISDNVTGKNITITIFDKNGTVLAREPEFDKWVGTNATNMPLVRTAMAKTEESAEVPGLDGAIRYYKFLPLIYGPGESGYLTVGAFKKEVVENVDRSFVRTLSFLVLASMGILSLNLVVAVRKN